MSESIKPVKTSKFAVLDLGHGLGDRDFMKK